jgi:hypothetical protein
MHMKLHNAYQINGVPLLGVFRVRTLEDLQMAHDMGFNLATSVNPEIFDPSTPMGRYASEVGFKGMYTITGPPHSSPRISTIISADATTIPFEFGKQPDPGPGIVVIDGERIRYADASETELVGCERGADGTVASAHRDGITIFWPEPLAADISNVKDSPNLWGYWSLDDTPGNVRSLMQGLTQTVHEVDGKHPVSAGFNSPDAMTNFGPGACDALVLYWYPSQSWGYNHQMTSLDTQAILSTTRKIAPDIPFIGLYQAFWGGNWNKQSPLTAFEIRDQAEAFVREGAAGLMAYAILNEEARGYYGFNLDSEMARAVKDINEEIRATGGLDVRPERPELAAVRMRAIGLQGEEPEVPGVPSAWHLATQFDVADSPGIDTTFPPDESIDIEATYVGKDGAQGNWEIVPAHTGTVAYFGDTPPSVRGDDTVIFAMCTVSSLIEQDVQLRLGCGEDMLVRVNGKVVIKYVGARGVHMDENIAYATLPVGESEILLKTHHKREGWGFTLRFTDVDGRPLEGVTFSPSVDAAAQR